MTSSTRWLAETSCAEGASENAAQDRSDRSCEDPPNRRACGDVGCMVNLYVDPACRHDRSERTNRELSCWRKTRSQERRSDDGCTRVSGGKARSFRLAQLHRSIVDLGPFAFEDRLDRAVDKAGFDTKCSARRYCAFGISESDRLRNAQPVPDLGEIGCLGCPVEDSVGNGVAPNNIPCLVDGTVDRLEGVGNLNSSCHAESTVLRDTRPATRCERQGWPAGRSRLLVL